MSDESDRRLILEMLEEVRAMLDNGVALTIIGGSLQGLSVYVARSAGLSHQLYIQTAAELWHSAEWDALLLKGDHETQVN